MYCFQPFKFRPIHFVVRPAENQRDSAAHTLNIYVWRSLDDVLETLRNVVPEFRKTVTANDVRNLARCDWCDYFAEKFAYDEFAAFWIIRTVWDPALAYPDENYDMFTIDGAVSYAKRLLTFDRQVAQSRLEYRRSIYPAPEDEKMKRILTREPRYVHNEAR